MWYNLYMLIVSDGIKIGININEDDIKDLIPINQNIKPKYNIKTSYIYIILITIILILFIRIVKLFN